MNDRGTEGTEKDPLTGLVIGAAIEVHRALGPGLLEDAYEQCLCHELSLRHVEFRYQDPLPVVYKGVRLDCGYRMDIVLPERLIIEVKSVSEIHPVHEAQFLTYMKLSGIRLGLLLNFNVPILKDGIRRMIL